MTVTVTVTVQKNGGKAKSYALTQTAKPTKGKNGKMTLAHFQPAPESEVIKTFSKLYIDTAKLK